MKVLYFGDVFGNPGRSAVKTAIEKLVTPNAIDFVIVNCENFAHGRGVLPKMADEFLDFGVDVLTTGNHVWDQKEIIPYIQTQERLLRPINFPNSSEFPNPGKGSFVAHGKRKSKASLGVVHAIGRVHMEDSDCPFQTANDEVMKMRRSGLRCIFVDFHAEATSEKQAFAHYMDGKVSAVVGSHSHVQTADERILAKGTAAITDVGMCGCYDSVIGVRKELSIEKFISKRPVKFEPADGPGGYCAVIVEIDETTGKALSIQRLQERIVAENRF